MRRPRATAQRSSSHTPSRCSQASDCSVFRPCSASSASGMPEHQIKRLSVVAAALAGAGGAGERGCAGGAYQERQTAQRGADQRPVGFRPVRAAGVAVPRSGRVAQEPQPPGAALQAKALRPLASEPGGERRGGDARERAAAAQEAHRAQPRAGDQAPQPETSAGLAALRAPVATTTAGQG